MDIGSFISSHLQAHYKKLIILCTATATLYLIKRYVDRKKKSGNQKKEKKKIKEFPTIEEIQKFIEDLPFNAVADGKDVTLRDLLGELSEFSEDEDWKELIASVHHMYHDDTSANKEVFDDAGSIMSIYEDPHVITLNEPTPRDENLDNMSLKSVNSLKSEDVANENRGKGDIEITAKPPPDESEKKEDSDSETLIIKSLGEGDISMEQI